MRACVRACVRVRVYSSRRQWECVVDRFLTNLHPLLGGVAGCMGDGALAVFINIKHIAHIFTVHRSHGSAHGISHNLHRRQSPHTSQTLRARKSCLPRTTPPSKSSMHHMRTHARHLQHTYNTRHTAVRILRSPHIHMQCNWSYVGARARHMLCQRSRQQAASIWNPGATPASVWGVRQWWDGRTSAGSMPFRFP